MKTRPTIQVVGVTELATEKNIYVCEADTHTPATEMCPISVSVPRFLTEILIIHLCYCFSPSLPLFQFNPTRMRYVVERTAFLYAEQSVCSYRRRGEPFVSLKPFRLIGETERKKPVAHNQNYF